VEEGAEALFGNTTKKVLPGSLRLVTRSKLEEDKVDIFG
jgi:hypothetical protein